MNQNTENKTYKERISGIKNNIKKGRTEAGITNLSRIKQNMFKDKRGQMTFFNNQIAIIV